MIQTVSFLNIDSSLSEFKSNKEKEHVWMCPEMFYKGLLVDEDDDFDDDLKYYWFNPNLWKHIKIHPVFKLPVFYDHKSNDFHLSR